MLIYWTFLAASWQNQQYDLSAQQRQISPGIRPVWSESLLSVWRNIGPLSTYWACNEDWSDWADAQADLSLRWAHIILLVLSCDCSFVLILSNMSKDSVKHVKGRPNVKIPFHGKDFLGYFGREKKYFIQHLTGEIECNLVMFCQDLQVTCT